jgi:hypothetical protein
MRLRGLGILNIRVRHDQVRNVTCDMIVYALFDLNQIQTVFLYNVHCRYIYGPL